MYDNIGSKIKGLAIIVFVIMAIISVIGGVLLLFNDNGGFFIGILTAGIGVLLSWIGTFFLYGFGQLIENTDILVYEVKKTSNNIQKVSTDSDQKNISTEKVTNNTASSNIKYCPLCGEKVTSKTCNFCGTENSLF